MSAVRPSESPPVAPAPPHPGPAESPEATKRSWEEANRRHLVAAVGEVRGLLEAHAASLESQPAAPGGKGPGDAGAGAGPETSPTPPPEATFPAGVAPPRLDQLVLHLGLSDFERRVLLLAAGPELEGTFGGLCARAQGVAETSYPTFSLALAAFPDAHWSALSPAAPLRYWQLVEVEAGSGLTAGRLAIDERILHFLLGVDYRDEHLAGLAEPLVPPDNLVPSHLALARRAAAAWSEAAGGAELPVVQLCGGDGVAKRAVAAGLCAMLDLVAYRMPADALPTGAAELERVIRLWQREAVLGRGALLLDCDAVDAHDSARQGVIRRVLDGVVSPLIQTSLRRRPVDLRAVLAFDVERPTADEQRQLWNEALAATTPEEERVGSDDDAAPGPIDRRVERLIGQFHLSGPMIQAACADALGAVADSEGDSNSEGGNLDELLWRTCRVQARPRLDDLAQRIEAVARAEDLVLPEGPTGLLREITQQVRWRYRVHRGWGFEGRDPRGLGIAALFAGASGTGKTMAAEVIASEVDIDLYRIELSAVVSKYIGETEKNLQRVFDAAEAGGAILLFDEADALFGKRTQVQDSHDRYANIEVSYLLQRMESYRGLAILTTNLKDSLDAAFLRRFRFIIDFPFPGPAERAEIWRRIFPAETPTAELDPEKLSRLNLAGGSIRNIALNGAFLAAAAGEPVRMKHLLQAARREYAKQAQPLPEIEVEDWL